MRCAVKLVLHLMGMIEILRGRDLTQLIHVLEPLLDKKSAMYSFCREPNAAANKLALQLHAECTAIWVGACGPLKLKALRSNQKKFITDLILQAKDCPESVLRSPDVLRIMVKHEYIESSSILIPPRGRGDGGGLRKSEKLDGQSACIEDKPIGDKALMSTATRAPKDQERKRGRGEEEEETAKLEADRLKKEGNTHFASHKYRDAVNAYDEAILADSKNAVLYSNRAAAFIRIWQQVNERKGPQMLIRDKLLKEAQALEIQMKNKRAQAEELSKVHGTLTNAAKLESQSKINRLVATEGQMLEQMQRLLVKAEKAFGEPMDDVHLHVHIRHDAVGRVVVHDGLQRMQGAAHVHTGTYVDHLPACREHLIKAIEDADHAISLAPKWSKGFFRKGAALAGLDRWDQAVQVLEKARHLDSSPEIVQLLSDCLKHLDARAHSLVEAGVETSGAISKTNALSNLNLKKNPLRQTRYSIERTCTVADFKRTILDTLGFPCDLIGLLRFAKQKNALLQFDDDDAPLVINQTEFAQLKRTSAVVELTLQGVYPCRVACYQNIKHSSLTLGSTKDWAIWSKVTQILVHRSVTGFDLKYCLAKESGILAPSSNASMWKLWHVVLRKNGTHRPYNWIRDDEEILGDDHGKHKGVLNMFLEENCGKRDGSLIFFKWWDSAELKLIDVGHFTYDPSTCLRATIQDAADRLFAPKLEIWKKPNFKLEELDVFEEITPHSIQPMASHESSLKALDVQAGDILIMQLKNVSGTSSSVDFFHQAIAAAVELMEAETNANIVKEREKVGTDFIARETVVRQVYLCGNIRMHIHVSACTHTLRLFFARDLSLANTHTHTHTHTHLHTHAHIHTHT